jgi:lipoate-protein ligase A
MVLEQLPEFPGDRPALESIRLGLDSHIQVYEWRGTDVILGRGTRLDPDINLANCGADNIPVRRRLGGGGAVVLMPGVWVITACYKKENKEINIPNTLERIALEIASTLQQLTGCVINLRGMGDLCLGEKKILGSSLYLGRGALLYQGSLLVDADLRLIGRYLNHPSKEPAYRKGRSHEDFVTNLSEACHVDTELMERMLIAALYRFKP